MSIFKILKEEGLLSSNLRKVDDSTLLNIFEEVKNILDTSRLSKEELFEYSSKMKKLGITELESIKSIIFLVLLEVSCRWQTKLSSGENAPFDVERALMYFRGR